jgi:hypothetical protein
MRTTAYQRFRPPHQLAEHLSDPAMPHAGYDALAEAKVARRPPEFVVIGEWRRLDDRRFLDLGINPDFLEAATNYRLHEGLIRWECPDCGKLGGKHVKACGYE